MDQQTYEKQVQARADEMLAVVAAQERHSAWTAHAVLASGGDPEGVDEAVSQTLGAVVAGAGDGDMGGPFHVLPAMLLHSRWEAQLPVAAAEMIRAFMLESVIVHTFSVPEGQLLESRLLILQGCKQHTSRTPLSPKF